MKQVSGAAVSRCGCGPPRATHTDRLTVVCHGPVSRPGSWSTCTVVSSICSFDPLRNRSMSNSSSGSQAAATAIIQSDMVRRDSSTPSRANCRSWRYSGSASQNLAVAMNASKPALASPFGISAGGGAATRTAGRSSSPEPSQ